jgi:hypothetical protein
MIYKYINTPFTYITYKRLGYTNKYFILLLQIIHTNYCDARQRRDRTARLEWNAGEEDGTRTRRCITDS